MGEASRWAVLSVRVLTHHHRLFQAAAEAQGITVSELMRRLVVEALREQLPALTDELLREDAAERGVP